MFFPVCASNAVFNASAGRQKFLSEACEGVSSNHTLLQHFQIGCGKSCFLNQNKIPSCCLFALVSLMQ